MVHQKERKMNKEDFAAGKPFRVSDSGMIYKYEDGKVFTAVDSSNLSLWHYEAMVLNYTQHSVDLITSVVGQTAAVTVMYSQMFPV